MPSLAILSIRGVGIVPPYTPKLPQPTLSTRMKTMLGFFPAGMDLVSCAWTYPTSMPRANAPRAQDRTQLEKFILSSSVHPICLAELVDLSLAVTGCKHQK